MQDAELVLVIGPPAAGKMTVGQEICKLTGLRLFHNHQSIDLALNYFDFGTPHFNELSDTIRDTVLRTVAASDLAGLVFTFVWAFDLAGDTAYVERIRDDWLERTGGRVTVLELQANAAERLIRNRHPDRLAAKPGKRDVDRSEKNLRHLDANHQLDSGGSLPLALPHLRVDNTRSSPADVAATFVDYIGLRRL